MMTKVKALRDAAHFVVNEYATHDARLFNAVATGKPIVHGLTSLPVDYENIIIGEFSSQIVKYRIEGCKFVILYDITNFPQIRATLSFQNVDEFDLPNASDYNTLRAAWNSKSIMRECVIICAINKTNPSLVIHYIRVPSV